MASALIFSSEEALLAALTSGLLPAEVQAMPVHFRRDEDGAIWVMPDERLESDIKKRLRAAGVAEKRRARRQDMRPARFWHQLIAPRRVTGDGQLERTVLFLLDQNPLLQNPLLDLAAELLRLGCNRCAYQLFESSGRRLGLVRAFSPPYYTVAACSERDAPYRAFVPAVSGQTRTWIELGHEHPLARAWQPAPGQIGLITGAGQWLDIPDGPWHDIFDFIEVSLPEQQSELTPVPPSRKLTVALELASATRTEPPSLWVLRSSDSVRSPTDRIDALVRTLPDDVIARLLFAALTRPNSQKTGQETTVVLRARHGRAGPPAIDIEGIAMVPYLGIGNLYVPHDAAVEPPLRRDTLRELLAPKDDRLYWLAPGPDDEPDDGHDPGHGRSFHIDSAPDRAFSPLRDWVEYLVHKNAEELAPWARSVTFEFEAFQSIGAEWTSQPGDWQDDRASDQDRRAGQRADRGESTRVGEAQVRQRRDTPVSVEAVEDPAAITEPEIGIIAPGEAETALAELERAFLDAGVPADHPSRTEMWLAMARLLGQLDRRRDAALCFVRALWELSGEDASYVASEWWRSEAAVTGPGLTAGDLAWLPMRDPRPPGADVLRTIAASWIAVWLGQVALPDPVGADGQIASHGPAVHAVQQWFDAHDRPLDARTSWLLRCALTAQVGGDPLGLARARDRILQDLRRGLSLERDVPAFLRFLRGHSGVGVGDSVAVAKLTERLETLVPLFDETKRERKSTEGSPGNTGAYVNLVLAYGFARLGQSEVANRLRNAARDQLDQDDPIHGFLLRAYSARINQALEGLPPEAPLPPPISRLLNDLPEFSRYKVDRLREASNILEAQERLAPFTEFRPKERSVFSEEFAALRGMSDPVSLTRELDRILAVATNAATSLKDRERIFDRSMDFLPLLPDARALPMLRTIIDAANDLPPTGRVLILEEALMLAGYFGREGLADNLAQSILKIVGELEGEEVAGLARAFGSSLRSLRRVGLRNRAANLIEALSAKLGGEGLEQLTAGVHLAAGLAYLGDFEQAQSILARAHAALADPDPQVEKRLPLIRALALAWGQCPQEYAFRGLDELAGQLAHITDGYSTNSHFCLSVIAFMEALVLGYARSDLELGELGRHWLDEDEYLVRRRIHRDFGGTS